LRFVSKAIHDPSAEKGNLDIYSMKADGSDVQQLTDSPALDAVPAWSPDGHSIVFSSDRSGKDTRRLFVMTRNGGDPTRVIAGSLPSEQMLADWQPRIGPKDACTIRGTINDDVIVGTPKPDVICGLAGNDTIRGLEGNDRLVGGPGADTLIGGRGVDLLDGGPGNDDLDVFDHQRDTVLGGAGRDVAHVDKKLDKVVGVERRVS